MLLLRYVAILQLFYYILYLRNDTMSLKVTEQISEAFKLNISQLGDFED